MVTARFGSRALPADGSLITLELERKHAEVARKNLERAGVSERVDIRVGPALETLPLIAAEQRGPFDLIFIDADKTSIPDYFLWALRLSRPGTLIIVDNVVRYAEAVFTAQQTLEDGQAFYRDLKARTRALGRDPDTIKILPGIVPVIGDTEAAALALEAEWTT